MVILAMRRFEAAERNRAAAVAVMILNALKVTKDDVIRNTTMIRFDLPTFTFFFEFGSTKQPKTLKSSSFFTYLLLTYLKIHDIECASAF